MTDQTNMDAINAAINAARAKAAETPAPVPATQASASNVVPYAPPAGRAVSVRELVEQAPLRADVFITVDKPGFTLGKEKTKYAERMKVRFKFNQAKAFYGVRYGANPAKYERSLDRILNVRTKQSWSETVAQAMRLDPKCKGDYPAVDVMFTAVEDVLSMKNEVLLTKGKTMLWTSSITNFAVFASFMEPYYALMDAGHLAEDAEVEGEIYHEIAEGGGNTWGLLKFGEFQLVGMGGEEAQAAA